MLLSQTLLIKNLQAVAARQMTRDANAPISPCESQIGKMTERRLVNCHWNLRKQGSTLKKAAPDRQMPVLVS
jgi:ribosome biogenesis protein Tsr3